MSNSPSSSSGYPPFDHPSFSWSPPSKTPNAPHMGYADLPDIDDEPLSPSSTLVSYGLPTPPSSPPRKQPPVHPLLWNRFRKMRSPSRFTKWNMIYPPHLSGPFPLYLPASGGLASADVLTQPATQPPSSFYHVACICPDAEGATPLPFPWGISITSPSKHEPITLHMFFTQLYAALSRPVSNGEFATLSEPHKQVTQMAGHRRRSVHAQAHIPGSSITARFDGLVRSDLLGDYVFFAGIDLLRDGSFVLKVSRSA